MARFKPTSLHKGETINLSKMDNFIESPLEQIHIGLGWDVHNDIQADLDAFVIQLDEDNKHIDLIYFNHLKSNDGAIKHTGDNLTGEGEGDDEVIYIDMDNLDPATKKIIVAVNIYQCRLTFNEVENAFVRILDRKTNELLVRYDLSYEFGKNYSMIAGELIKNEDSTWDFKAVGNATQDRDIQQVLSKVSTGKRTNPTVKKGFFSRFFGL